MNIVSNWKKILPLIGVLVLVVLIWKIDINKIWMVTKQINIRYLLILPITIITILILQALKWQCILIKQEFNIRFKEVFKITWISFFYATITPGRLGNLIKMSYLKDTTENSVVECSTSVLVDKFLDAVVLFLFALIGAYLLIDKFSGVFILIAGIFIILIVSISFFHDKARTKSFLKLVFAFVMTEKMKNKFGEPFEVFFESMPAKRWLILPLVLTILTWVVIFSESFIIAKSLHIQMSFMTFIFLMPLGTVAGLIPISISGLGTREAVLVSVFVLYGIAPEKVMSMSLVGLILCAYIPAFAGWVFSFQKSK